jgi:hypothetical protein
MSRRATQKQMLNEGHAVALLSAAECARLCRENRRESSAELNEQIGLVVWRLQGRLSRRERREGYHRLKVLLWRKYGGGMQ